MTPRSIPAPPITETEWQQVAVALLHSLGWRHLHVRRTIGRGKKWVTSTNVVGWPDLYAWHEGQRRQVAIELKSERGATSPEQVAVLASLAAAGVETMVARPSDFDALVAFLRPCALPPDDVEHDEGGSGCCARGFCGPERQARFAKKDRS